MIPWRAWRAWRHLRGRAHSRGGAAADPTKRLAASPAFPPSRDILSYNYLVIKLLIFRWTPKTRQMEMQHRHACAKMRSTVHLHTFAYVPMSQSQSQCALYLKHSAASSGMSD